MGIIDLQCCNHCHLLIDIPSKFQSSMTIFHYIDVKMQNIPDFILHSRNVSWDDNYWKLIIKKFHQVVLLMRYIIGVQILKELFLVEEM